MSEWKCLICECEEYYSIEAYSANECMGCSNIFRFPKKFCKKVTLREKIVFEPGKYYKTRDGRKAAIFSVDADDTWPISGFVELDSGEWEDEDWLSSGDYFPSDNDKSGTDLIDYWEDDDES